MCKESRSATRHFYQTLQGYGFYTSKGTLFNAKLDIVYCAQTPLRCQDFDYFSVPRPPHFYFPNRYLLHRLSLHEEDVERITRLVIPLYAFKFREDIIGWNIKDVVHILRRYSSLKELILFPEARSRAPPARRRWSRFSRRPRNGKNPATGRMRQ